MFKSIKLRIIEGRKLKPFATAKVLQEHEDKINAIVGTDTSELAEIGELQTVVGDENSGLVKDVNTLKTSKANSNHTHTVSNVSDLDTVEAVVTYTDESTETILLVKQVSE